ncbi:MAG: UbiH/UbiF family hydroxylase, partial [Gemmobacter sp.]
SPATLGDRAMLDAYARARRSDIAMRVAGIDLLNRASMARAPALHALRARTLDMLHGLGPVRRTLMRTGLGLR